MLFRSAMKFNNWVVSHKMVPFWSGKIEDIYPYQARGIIAGLERIRTAIEKKRLSKQGAPRRNNDITVSRNDDKE